jgi:hypothetical protein
MSLQSGKGTDFCRSCLWPKRSVASARCGTCAAHLSGRARYKNPAEHEAFRARMEKYRGRPGAREQMASRMKQMWASPEYLERQRLAHKKYFERPGAIERNRETQKNCLAHRVAMASPEYREKLRLAQQRAWKRSETREKRLASMKKTFATPEYREKRSGANSFAWRGGASLEPYGREFTRTLRKTIKCRDEYTCQNPRCYVPENGRPHHIHHIDYIKKHNDSRNLVTLCFSCHEKTISGNRDYWTEYYQAIQHARGLGLCT